jgi:hypothetical protein
MGSDNKTLSKILKIFQNKNKIFRILPGFIRLSFGTALKDGATESVR